jgi:hypothetical protein
MTDEIEITSGMVAAAKDAIWDYLAWTDYSFSAEERTAMAEEALAAALEVWKNETCEELLLDVRLLESAA